MSLEIHIFIHEEQRAKKGESLVGWNKRGDCTDKWNHGWSLGRNWRVESCYRGCKVSVLGWSWVSNTEASSGYFKESRKKNRSHQVNHMAWWLEEAWGRKWPQVLTSFRAPEWVCILHFSRKEGNVYGTQRVNFEVHSIAFRLYSEFK